MEITERHENIDWFGGLENLSIIHISDIHLWYGTSILKKLESIITSHNPDLVILTGDYYDLPRGAYNFREFLCKISQEHKVVFIRGNHDRLYGKKIANLLLGIPNCFCVEESIYKHSSKQRTSLQHYIVAKQAQPAG